MTWCKETGMRRKRWKWTTTTRRVMRMKRRCGDLSGKPNSAARRMK
jgi:hypothetical protein